MLPFLSSWLEPFWGPFRLLSSRMVLMMIGVLLCASLVWWLLPHCYGFLPHDRGKNFVKDSALSKGKPTGAGMPLVLIYLFCAFLVLPFYTEYALIGLCLLAIMLTGYFDDRSTASWGQLKKGLLDLAISLAAAWVIAHWQSPRIWLPFVKSGHDGGCFLVPLYVYIPVAAALLWLTINTVNCSDGVDGVAGSLALFGLCGMGAFLYGIMGHSTVSAYLLLPLVENGASWAIMLLTAAGALAAYLWYNASPSQVMMGDAGSRFFGLLLGLSILASGNPFMLLAIAPILFINGGAGLIKLVVLRLLKRMGFDTRPPLSAVPNPIHPENFASDEEAARQIPLVRLLHRYRFPIHDHCRKNLGWSDTQVLMRFMLLQALIMPIVIILMVKLR